MARAAEMNTRAPSAPPPAAATSESQVAPVAVAERPEPEKDKVLPLPRWLTRVYFIFPVVLYIPDALFNYYVYSDGLKPVSENGVIQAGYVALWIFLSVGVVGMAYLLSVLAPWHWGQGHRIQAVFCGVGVIVATAITTWNSLAYRSQAFVSFKTDEWIWALWPQLRTHNISITMILVAIAPPFWGLFWAIVQPTETGRSLRQIKESHEEKLLRLQQEAELKAVRAEAMARVRAAQLKGMAATAAAAREQAKELFNRKGENAPTEAGDGASASTDAPTASAPAASTGSPEDSGSAHNVIRYPAPATAAREPAASGRGGMAFYNHAAATPTVHAAPATATATRTDVAQPSLLLAADVQGTGGTPASDAVTFTPTPRRAATFFGDELVAQPYEMSDAEAMTGTSGPRRAIRRPTELGTLTRTLNEPVPPQVAETIRGVMRELNPQGGKKTIPSKVLVPAVAERLNVDTVTAQKLVSRYMKAEQQRTRSAD